VPGKLIKFFRVKNIGRSTALLKRVDEGWSVGQQLPNEPFYQQFEINPNGDAALDPGEGRDFGINPPFEVDLLGEHQAAADAGNVLLWFYCRCTYRDIQARQHVRSYCWVWRRHADGRFHFVVDDHAPPAYFERADDYSDF